MLLAVPQLAYADHCTPPQVHDQVDPGLCVDPPPDSAPVESAWTEDNVRAAGLALALLVFLAAAGLTRGFARGSKAA